MKLEINHVSKTYGAVKALDDVCLSLDNGVYGLLGPNGAGKSTLIHLLTDNVRRETGDILWEGKEIRSLGASYRKQIGYMPQQQGYYEEYTANAFLVYMGRLKGMEKKAAANRAQELLAAVNLTEAGKKRLGAFSGGMLQRLLLAQALMNDPKLLILDEPTAGVDPQERIRIRNFISKIAADRIVLLATHIVSDVESIADEILLMKAGRLVKKAAVGDLLAEIQPKVFEIEIPRERLDAVQRQYLVSNVRSTKDGLAVKVISKTPPEAEPFAQAAANLEDVYLYYFR